MSGMNETKEKENFSFAVNGFVLFLGIVFLTDESSSKLWLFVQVQRHESTKNWREKKHKQQQSNAENKIYINLYYFDFSEERKENKTKIISRRSLIWKSKSKTETENVCVFFFFS